MYKILSSEIDGVFRINETYDFTGFPLAQLIEKDWTNCFVGSKSITFDGIVYRVNIEHPQY